MLLLLSLAMQLSMPNGDRDVILGPGKAYVMLEPTFVCGASVERLQWSPDSKFLSAVRETNSITAAGLRNRLLETKEPVPEKQVEIWFWSMQSKSGRAVFKGSAETYSIYNLEWIGSSGTAIATVDVSIEDVNVREFWLVRSNGVRKLDVSPAAAWQSAKVSTTHDIGALTSTNRPDVVRFFDSTGKLGPELTLTESTHYLDWNGNIPMLSVPRREGNRRVTVSHFAISQRTGALTPSNRTERAVEFKEGIHPVDAKAEINLSRDTIRTSAAGAAYVDSKGEGGDRVGLVSADAKDFQVAPNNRAIAYISQGLAFVRELVSLPRDAYEKVETIDKAKQVGVALIIYSVDADDEFPPNDNWRERASPYTKDLSLLKDFTYLLNGGKLPANVDPSTVVIGFLSGAGGRAVVYGDGSVKWEKP